MADQFVAEIRLFPFNFAPTGWAMCQGQLVSISQYTALFSLLGTYFGGNGTSNFALPNLQSAVPMGQGSGPGLTPRNIGDTGGEESVTLLGTQIPSGNRQSARGGPGAGRGPRAGGGRL
jgi:microcystin-dependent protein